MAGTVSHIFNDCLLWYPSAEIGGGFVMKSYEWLKSALLTLTLCVVVAGGTILAAQTPATETRQIDGTVLDRQGLPVSGASVTVTQKQGSLQKSAHTATGKFKVEGLAAASYDVKIEAAGFTPKTLAVDFER